MENWKIVNRKIVKLFKEVLNFKSDRDNDVMEISNTLFTEERKILYSLKFLYSHIINKSDVSPCFENYYSINDSNTRGKGDIITKYPKTACGQKSFLYWCSKIWNSLSPPLKKVKSSSQFDKMIRQELLKKRSDEFVYQKFRF